MLNPDFRLAAGASHGTVGVAWTAPAGNSVSFVFVDGRMAVEAFTPGIAERAIDVPLAAGALAVIEVHDINPGDVPAHAAPRYYHPAHGVYPTRHPFRRRPRRCPLSALPSSGGRNRVAGLGGGGFAHGW